MVRSPQEPSNKTKSITLRFPERILNEIEYMAKQEGVSINVMVGQILESFIEWESSARDGDWIVMPRLVLIKLMEQLDEVSLMKVASGVQGTYKDILVYMKGSSDLDTWISYLKHRAKRSGFHIRQINRNSKTTIIMQHYMGRKWSIFFKKLYEDVLKDLGEKGVVEFTDDAIIICF